MSSDTITIAKEEHIRLRRAKLMLECLEAGGVDNWDWYGDAINEFCKEAIKQGIATKYEMDDDYVQ